MPARLGSTSPPVATVGVHVFSQGKGGKFVWGRQSRPGPGWRTHVASAPEPWWHGTARAVDEKGWQLTKGGGSAEDTAPVVGGTLACADSKAPARQRKARRGN